MKASFVLTGAVALAAAVNLAAAAVDMPIPKLMSDVPTDSGKWKMDWVQGPDGSKAPAAAAGGGMMICNTAAKALSGDRTEGAKSNCQFKLLEDGAARAVMEYRCPDRGSSRTTITKLATRSYEMSVEQLDRAGAKPMIVRMSYMGPCSASDSVMSYEKDSPVCQKMRAQMPALEKNAKSACASGGRAACEAVERQLAQFRAMCGDK